jgi:hypothetical protein
VCPEKMKPTRGIFYVQAEDGSPVAEPEFVLEPQAAPRRTPASPAATPGHIEPPVRETELSESRPEQPAAPPEEAVTPAPRSSRWYWALFAAAWCIAVASAAFAFHGYWLPQPPAPRAVTGEDPRVRELTREVQDLKAELEALRKRLEEPKK